MSSVGTTARGDEPATISRATYQDVLDAPAHRVAEVVDGTLHAREGVGHLWLVDPADRTLEAFELREGYWVLIAAGKDDDPISVPPFHAITFGLDALRP